MRLARAFAATNASGLFIILACTTETRASAPEPASARLGFSFDQQAHNAAQKTLSSGSSVGDEPAPRDVLRLPKYMVSEKPMAFEQDELLTPAGKVEVAKKRYLNPMYQKTLGPVIGILSLAHNVNGGWNPNTPEAMAIYEDFKQRDRNNRMSDLTALSELAEQSKRLETRARGPTNQSEKKQ
jgi:hypothetical protein